MRLHTVYDVVYIHILHFVSCTYSYLFPHRGLFMFRVISFSGVVHLTLSTASKKDTELNSEACVHYSPLSTVKGLTSKPLFIPQPTVVTQPKCQWVRSYLPACFLCPLPHKGELPKKSFFFQTKEGFFPSGLGRKQSAFTAF